MSDSSNKIFGCKYLRYNIWKYIINKRCLSCKQKLINNNLITYSHHKYYNNTIWRSQSNCYINSVCNWCYYYVYEYP